MDIYSFINSPDIANHCRNIGHVFDSLEMAVLIAMSEKTINEKNEAWQEIIAYYPDMPIRKRNGFKAKKSLHDYLQNLIALNEKWLMEFYTPETGAVYRTVVYRYREEKDADSCYSTADKAWAAFCETWSWKENHIDSVHIVKEFIDADEHPREVCVNPSGEVLDCIGHSDGYPDTLDEIFIDLPLPFERGDILACWDTVFVLDSVPHWNDGTWKKYEEFLTGEVNDRTDMIGRGLFASDEGILYSGHTGYYDNYQYYRGKLEGANRLLHYVSLYMKGEHGFHLPELLTMQCRIMLEEQLRSSLLMKSYGCYIPDSLLAENRLTPEEKEEIKTNGLMP